MQRRLDPAAHGDGVPNAGIHIVSSSAAATLTVQNQAQNPFQTVFFSVHSKPQSSQVPVVDLVQSLKTGPFTAVRERSASTPIHQATIDR